MYLLLLVDIYFVFRSLSSCLFSITGKRQITAPSVFSDDSLLSTKRNKTILENQRRSDDPKDLISKTQLSTKEYICYLQAVLKDFPRLTVLQIAIDKLNALLETTTVQEAKIQEQSEAISEQNLVIEDLQRNLQRVKDLMSKHKTSLQLAEDCEAGKALTTQEFEAFQLLQELSLELIDSFEDDEDADDDDDDEREDSLEMDIVQPDLLTNPNPGLKLFPMFLPRQPPPPPPPTTNRNRDPERSKKRPRKTHKSNVAQELQRHITLVSKGFFFFFFLNPCQCNCCTDSIR